MLGCPWQQAWDHLSTIPARFMGLPSADLSPAGAPASAAGPAADFCLLRFTGGEQPGRLGVYQDGECVAETPVPLEPLG
jgi:hypothetical protein